MPSQEVSSRPTYKIIYVIGEVNENTTECITKELLETDWTADNVKELHIYICSEGGYLRDCFAIIDIIEGIRARHDILIRTYGLGEVASAGFFIFLLGDERILYPSCRTFVHEHITIGDEKTYGERIKADKTEEKEVYDNYVKFTSDRLGITSIKAKNLLRKNKWLTKKEVRNYNIHKELSNE